jgi:hypothetical protein
MIIAIQLIEIHYLIKIQIILWIKVFDLTHQKIQNFQTKI